MSQTMMMTLKLLSDSNVLSREIDLNYIKYQMLEGLLEPLKYLWNTVTREIQDEITIISDITQYYRQ